MSGLLSGSSARGFPGSEPVSLKVARKLCSDADSLLLDILMYIDFKCMNCIVNKTQTSPCTLLQSPRSSRMAALFSSPLETGLSRPGSTGVRGQSCPLAVMFQSHPPIETKLVVSSQHLPPDLTSSSSVSFCEFLAFFLYNLVSYWVIRDSRGHRNSHKLFS